MRDFEQEYLPLVPNISYLTRAEFEVKMAERRGEGPVSHERRNTWRSEIMGEPPFSYKEYHAETTRRFDGEVPLAKGTLLSYQNFIVPAEITPENVEHVMLEREIAKIAFGRLYVNEPGVVFRRIKNAGAGVYLQHPNMVAAPNFQAAEAVYHYVHDRLEGVKKHDVLMRAANESIRLMRDITASNEAYIKQMIEEIAPNGA